MRALSDPGFGSPVDAGPPSWFVGFFVLFLLFGIGTTIWRVTLARQVARDSGMDPDRATAMTLLSDDGLDATYLAGSLRGPGGPAASPQPVQHSATAAERLRQLESLRNEGLISSEEYDTRRRAILDSL